jgi:hypothetical protein
LAQDSVQVPARGRPGGHGCGDLAGFGGCLGLFLAGAVPLEFALPETGDRIAVVIRLGRSGPGLAGGVGGDLGLDVGWVQLV